MADQSVVVGAHTSRSLSPTDPNWRPWSPALPAVPGRCGPPIAVSAELGSARSGDRFTGTAWTFTTDNADLRGTGNNDAVVSMKVQTNPSSWFRITNVTNGPALDGGGNVPSGSSLKQWTWNGSTNLQWQAVELGNGHYKLVNRATGLVLDGGGNVPSGSVG